MKALRALQPGGPEVLAVCELPEPLPGNNEVAIDVHAAALNRADLLQRRGLYPPPPGVSDVLGLECAGTIAALGPGAGSVRVGERVMTLVPGGGCAERVVVPEAMAMPIPRGTSFEQAAAIPEAFLTAREALFQAGRLAPGESLLVHAAASGVGSAAVQLGAAAGARVFGTASGAEKGARVQAFGAEAVIDYTVEDFAERLSELLAGRGVDVILDLVGASYAERNLNLLADGGRQVVVGLVGGAQAKVDFGKLLRKRATLVGIVMRTRPWLDKIGMARAFVRESLPLFESGRLRAVVDSVLPLSRAAEAHARMEANANVGKIVLRLR